MACSSGDAMGMVLEVWRDWQTTIMMVVAAGLQLALVAAGIVRKRVVKRSFHAMVLLTFLGLDAASFYSLGLMFAASSTPIFAIWAPLSLFHMSGSDSINAYSPADNELWRRYLFKLLLSLSFASFILSRSRNCQRYLLVSLLLAVLGSFKLCERVFCLYRGSRLQILAASRPIFAFMADQRLRCTDSAASPYPDVLLVSGESQWYARHATEERRNVGVTPPSPSDIEEQARLRTQPQDDDLVLYRDIQNDDDLCNRHDILHLCLAYALFKIYRRRLSNLRIPLSDEHNQFIRELFDNAISSNHIFRVLDLEMSFIFDSIFTKAAAGRLFQGVGMLTRLLSLAVLFIALLTLVSVQALDVACGSGDASTNAACAGAKGPVEGLTFLFLVVAMAVECLQIYRHIKCDAFRVWLACKYVLAKRQGGSDGKTAVFYDCYAELILAILDYSSAAHINSRSNSECLGSLFQQLSSMSHATFLGVGGGGDKHWHYTVTQRSILADAMVKLGQHYLVQLDIKRMRKAKLLWSEIENLYAVLDVDDLQNLQELLFKKIQGLRKELKRQEGGDQNLREYVEEKVGRPFKAFRNNEEVEEDADLEGVALEEVVLYYHLATSACELQILRNSGAADSEEKVKRSVEEEEEETSKKVSVRLSRYCLHLLLKRPKLIAVDPDLVKRKYVQHREEMKASLKEVYLKEALEVEAAALGGQSKLLRWMVWFEQQKERWSTLCEVWVGILALMAVGGSSPPHAEQMARGGELLTIVWLLLSHLGMAPSSV